jgi:threonine synthase
MNELLSNSPGSNTSFALIDGVAPVDLNISKETENLRKIVGSEKNSQMERLAAYEDIMNIEVGDTSLTRARNIEREAGLRQIFLKFEGGNPTGTQKDRIAFAQCLDALRRGFDTITIATCGNYGVAVALAAYLANLRCIIFIPESYHTRRINEMIKLGAEIRRSPGDYEKAVVISINIAIEKDYYDANPGGANKHLQFMAYAEIANEIYDVIRDAPKAISVPVSNGTLLAGIYRGFSTLYKRGKTSRIPKMVAGSAFKKNPIVLSFKRNLESCEDLRPETIKETLVNEPLINWHSLDGDEALMAIRESGGWADDISDLKLLKYAKTLRDKEGLNVLPASTAGLIAFLNEHNRESMEGDRYVSILTGRK